MIAFRKFWLMPIAVFAILAGGTLFMMFSNLFSFTEHLWLLNLSVCTILYIASFIVFQKSLNAEPAKSAMLFLVLTVAKMLLAMIYILVMVAGEYFSSKAAYLHFIIMYLMLLMTEVLAFVRLLKEKSVNFPEKLS